MNQLNDNKTNVFKGFQVYGRYTFSEIERLECGGLYAECIIFERCFENMLPELPHINEMELINDSKTYEGEYDDITGGRHEAARAIPASRKSFALDILLDCPDRFAEWMDENGDAV